jgi:cytochrome P450
MTTQTYDGIDAELAAVLQSTPEAMADPFGIWDRLRDEGPASRRAGIVFATRYPEVKELLKASGTSRYSKMWSNSAAQAELMKRLPADEVALVHEYNAFLANILDRQSPEGHLRLRRIAHRAFTPKRIAALEDSVQRFCSELIEPFEQAGGGDFMTLAYDMPLKMVVEMLDVPQSDREQLHDWSMAIANNIDQPHDPERLRLAVDAIREFGAYLDDVIAVRRGETASSELAELLLEAGDGGQMTVEEVKAMFVVVIFAGHETMTNLIGRGLLALHQQRDQWELLCADPELAGPGVDELLRFVTPVQFVPRVAMERHTIGDVTVEAGDTVYGVLRAANRDESVFADPDRLDLKRSNSREHLALGFGPHFCLGASLARLQGRVLFGRLAERFPDMRVRTTDLQYVGHTLLPRLAHLEVEMGPPRAAAAATPSTVPQCPVSH